MSYNNLEFLSSNLRSMELNRELPHPLNRTSSLMDNMGIQRSGSPFLARSQSNVTVFQDLSTPNAPAHAPAPAAGAGIVPGSVPGALPSGPSGITGINSTGAMDQTMLMSTTASAGTSVASGVQLDIDNRSVDGDWFSQLPKQSVLHQSTSQLPNQQQQQTQMGASIFNPQVMSQQTSPGFPQVSVGSGMPMMPPGVHPQGGGTGMVPPQFIIIESQWKYIDTLGQVQGPFSSKDMSQWYHMGFFSSSLDISRVGNSPEPFGINDKFMKLSELIDKVRNVQEPFRTFDFIVAQANNGPKPPGLNSAPGFNQLSDTGNHLMNSNPSQQSQQQPGAVNASMATLPTSIPNAVTVEDRPYEPNALKRIESPDYTYDQVINLKSYKKGNEYYYRETTIRVPVNRPLVKKLDRNENIIVSNTPAISPISYDMAEIAELERIAKIDQQRKEEAEKIKLTEIEINAKQELESRSKEEAQADAEREQKKAVDELKKKKQEEKNLQLQKQKEEEQKRIEKANKMALKLLQEQEKEKEVKKMKDSKPAKKSKKQVSESKTSSADHGSQIKEESPQVGQKSDAENQNNQAGTPIISQPAPWANKSATPVVEDLPSISELQKLKTSKKKKSINDPETRNNLLKLHQEIVQEEKSKEQLSSMLKWANKSSSTSEASSIIDLKEQVKGSKKSKKASPTASNQLPSLNSESNILNDPKIVEEQKKIWEQIQKTSSVKGKKTDITSSLLASTGNSLPLSNSGSSNANPWKSVPTSVPAPVTKTLSTTAPQKSSLNPDKLRANSTNTTSKTSAKQIGSSTVNPLLKSKQPVNLYPGNSSISIRQDFIKWCKSQMKLKDGVNSRDVLEVLLSLPPGMDSKEIIADTIYSYSATMDGRRFATDFIKRRIDCEKKVNDPLNWSEVLSLPEGNNDDWEFQVVSKKKTRKY
ncbi:Protein SMY2 [Nakaseomyces bracarensis]|uniref:Protein SMY2 n=1 Tax=Nakaseomyces bracarensis TaxID=273131 RepID=A0ABR4NU42_9SACH